MNKRKKLLVICAIIMVICVLIGVFVEPLYEIASNIFSIGFFCVFIILFCTRKKKRKSALNINFDSMSGHEFERFCASLLKNNGFKKVKVTQGSGDHGVDILAEFNGNKYAIQCKRYEKNVGNKAIQEIFSGKAIYGADVAVVLTNSYFTEQAKNDAKKLGVYLWDRKKLISFIRSVENNDKKNQDDFTKKNENTLELIDAERGVIEIRDDSNKGLSNTLYIFMERASRAAIDLFIKTGDGNPNTEEMIKCIERPIIFYCASYRIEMGMLTFTYHCEISNFFKHTNIYKRLEAIDDKSGRKTRYDLFEIDVIYGIDDIVFDINDNPKIKLKHMPEVSIFPDSAENINNEEEIEKNTVEFRHYVTQSCFPIKMDNFHLDMD